MFSDGYVNRIGIFFNKSLLTALVFLLFFNFVEASKPDVVINEVAWMGNEDSSSSEWIELKNLEGEDIDLEGWILEIDDKEIELEGEIEEDGFYLLERTDDNSIEDVEADLIYKGSLSNNGEDLVLRNADGDKIDELDFDDGWPAGDNGTKQTMERSEDEEWQNSEKPGGTPGEDNSDGPKEEDQKCSVDAQPDLKKVIINEIFPDPEENEEENEWIEIINLSSSDIDLEGCFLADENLFEKQDLGDYFVFDSDDEIEPGNFKVVERKDFDFGMNNGGEKVYFLDGEGGVLDKISYEDAEENFSYSLNEKGDWMWSPILTPGEINQFPEIQEYSRKLEITELMPNPEGDDKNKEWVEILNSDKDEIDLGKWYFINQSNKIFELDGLEIKSNKRLKVEIKNTTFTLRNSEGSLQLIDPNNEVVDTVSYSNSAKQGSSLNKNSNNKWEWSIFSTPGKENKLNNEPTYKVDIPDKIYEDVKVELKIEKVEDEDDEDLKYRWDFGDDSRSYLKETSHVFGENGNYTIQTRVSDLSVDIFKYFNIRVRKFPELDIKIIKILPNPSGSDSDNEKVWLVNEERKTVNLKGWSIATGSSMKKLVNHYFKDDFKIKAGDIKIVDRGDCPFSLLNSKGRVVLKSPDGEVVDKVKYEKEKIEEDELYYLENGEWFWSIPIKIEEEISETLGGNILNAENNQTVLALGDLTNNSEFKRSDRLKVIIFDNWLFAQSQGYFFDLIFPESIRRRIQSSEIFTKEA